MGILENIDHAFYKGLTRRWERERIDGFVKSLRVYDDNSGIPNVVGRTFGIIDAKAAALLTHTSMMIAALGISSSVVAETQLEQAVIIIEILGYLIISIICLRCISLFHEPPEYDDNRLSEAVRDELILRRGLYRLCNRSTIYLTIIVLISLPILFVT